MAVCLLPGSSNSIAGSGIQFSLQNIGKLVIPAVGGMVIDYLGDKVVLGFHIVVLSCGFLAVATSTAAYQAALRRERDIAILLPKEAKKKYGSNEIDGETEESIVI